MATNRRRTRFLKWVGLIIVAAVIAGVLARKAPGFYWSWRSDNPVRRGAALASEQGCLACHAPRGRDETSNPGSRWGTVPSFFRGNTMMYVRSADQVRNFIAYGNAEGKPEDADHEDAAEHSHPFHMPAFGDRLDQHEIGDLASFVLAADGYLVPPEGAVARGAEIAAGYGCEGCHGVSGAGGVGNPRSFTGTVPGWVGADFAHLVADKAEFGEWVHDGRSARWRNSRAASFFLDRANLRMPAFRGNLSDDDVADLWSYVEWLRSDEGPALTDGE